MRLTPASELAHRNTTLQRYMTEEGLDAIIIVQNADLFYFTGTVQSGNLYVPAQGEPLYLVRKDHGRARRESALQEVIPFGSMKDIPARLAEYGYPTPGRIGLELDVLPVNFYERFRKTFPGAAFTDATPLIRRVRMIKSPYEMESIRASADQQDAIFRRAGEIIREGISELELAAELESVARRLGHQVLVRMRGFNSELIFAHIFSGPDTALPSYPDTPLGGRGLNPSFGQGTTWKQLVRDEAIIVDFAASTDGYLSDQTRVFAINSLPARLRRGYDDMRKVQERMMAIATPGTPWGAVYNECLALAVGMGYADSFMGAPGSQVSFIGHGLGIEIDEYPFIARGFDDMLLENGMVFAFEPKLVFPGEGAIGIENTFHLDQGQVKKLTYSSEEPVILAG
jgi:Xaa-Pro dipeptidase